MKIICLMDVFSFHILHSSIFCMIDLEGVYTCIFTMAWVLIPKWSLTPLCFHVRLWDWIEFHSGYFFLWFQCLNQIFFYSGLKSDFFVQSEVIWKPHHSEFYSLVSYKVIKQIAYKNVKWMKDGWIRTPKVEIITRKKRHVNTGYWRIKTKVKQVRQDYRKPIGKRRRSRSGKLVCDS